VVKAVADRPLVVGHGLNQVVLALHFFEGEYAVRMNHRISPLTNMNDNGCLELNNFLVDKAFVQN
jgi:hypothetical protein